jgi:hypothetical protein
MQQIFLPLRGYTNRLILKRELDSAVSSAGSTKKMEALMDLSLWIVSRIPLSALRSFGNFFGGLFCDISPKCRWETLNNSNRIELGHLTACESSHRMERSLMPADFSGTCQIVPWMRKAIVTLLRAVSLEQQLRQGRCSCCGMSA